MRRSDPRSAFAILLLAFGCSQSGGDSALDPDAVAANNRGVGLMGTFDYEGARGVFADLVERHPDWLDARANLAIATLNRQLDGDDEIALATLESVLEVDPGHLRARYLVGLLRLFVGDVAEAERHLRAVAASDPEDAYAHYYLGQSLAQQQRQEEAIASYRRALDADPLLRSAHFAASQVLRRLGQSEEAAERLRSYERLERNPQARLAEFKYTRMGPKGMAATVDLVSSEPLPRRHGPVFAAAARVPVRRAPRQDDPIDAPEGSAAITTADLSGDGRLDLFVPGVLEGTGPVNAVLVGSAEGFEARPAHPLAGVDGVDSALWGDLDNDGLVDAYLLRRGANQLWRQTSPGTWEDVTAAAGAGGSELDTVDGAVFDADHDGDLDLFLVNANGPNELLNNDLDGTFRPLAAERGIDGGSRASRSVLATDLDGDRDVDLVVLHAQPPHEVFWNDRLWEYRPASGFDLLRDASLAALLAADLDSDGETEIYALSDSGELSVWQADDAKIWSARSLSSSPFDHTPQLAVADVTGDGSLEILRSSGDGWSAVSLSSEGSEILFDAASDFAVTSWAPVLIDPARGPSVVAVRVDGSLAVWGPGAGRHPFLSVGFTGRANTAESMRSNASGIGTRAAFRVGSRWTVTDTYRRHSGPGQSLQPLAVGLGGRDRVDFVAIDWSDGVFQSESDLKSGRLHRIAETQRQLSSCPLLFAWNGAEFAFVSDVLGVGGIGMLVKPGVWAPSRPFESFLLPTGLLRSSEGRYRLKIAQMMEEVSYLDSAELIAYDLPPGWQMVLDERMGTAPPDPTGEPRFYRAEWVPARAFNERGEDVGSSLRETDGVAAPPGRLDRRFIGLLEREHVLELAFPTDLDATAGDLLLVIDGWLEYPYAQTVFAAWQAGARYEPLTLEAREPGGTWRVILDRFGYPAGMPRRMSVPLHGLAPGTRELRISTNQEIYLDRVSVVRAESTDEVRRHSLSLSKASVAQVGFAKRELHAQRRPDYRYAERTPFWDTRHPRGWYTAFGPALELLERADDALAILGPGEEVDLEFAAPTEDEPPGWTRHFVLAARGWAKDMDIYTQDGGSVEPLPTAGHAPDARNRLHARFNVRYAAGR